MYRLVVFTLMLFAVFQSGPVLAGTGKSICVLSTLGDKATFFRFANSTQSIFSVPDWKIDDETVKVVGVNLKKSGYEKIINLNYLRGNVLSQYIANKKNSMFQLTERLKSYVSNQCLKKGGDFLLIIGNDRSRVYLDSDGHVIDAIAGKAGSEFYSVVNDGYGYYDFYGESLHATFTSYAFFVDVRNKKVLNKGPLHSFRNVKIIRKLTGEEKGKIYKYVTNGFFADSVLNKYKKLVYQNYIDAEQRKLIEKEYSSDNGMTSGIDNEVDILVKMMNPVYLTFEKLKKLTRKQSLDLGWFMNELKTIALNKVGRFVASDSP